MNVASKIHGMIVPHAPTLLEDEMVGAMSPVITALQESGKKLKEWGVEVVVAVTTHWQTKENFSIDNSKFHNTVTDYHGFKAEVQYDVLGHPELAELLYKAGEKNLVFPQMTKRGVDHAVTIPLHFMFPEQDVPVIPLSISGSPICAFRWGRTLGHTLRQWGGKVLFLVSGSLSHDLRGFMTGKIRTEHPIFDQQVLQLIKEGRGMDVLEIDKHLIEIAKPEGGFRDLYMLLGVMGAQAHGTTLAYEKLPGVGMGIVEFADSGDHERDEERLKYCQSGGVIH